MNRSQIILSVLAIALVVFLFQLPTVVVENETGAVVEMHDMGVSDTDATAIQSLRDLVIKSESQNLANFADSLAKYYLKYGYLDSAVSVAGEYLVKEQSSLKSLRSAGNVYYAAFERSQTSEEATERIALARNVYQQIVELDSEDLLSQTRLAMTMVTTENPMAGIMMLRKVLEVDPEFRDAILNLGLLSIRSGQYDKAVDRFSKLMEKDSSDYEALLYLAIATKEIEPELATIYFEQIVETTGADPALVVTAQQYLQEN
jgi:tetratricopeptide (TPR) repeat protein